MLTENLLLAGLPTSVQASLRPRLELVSLRPEECLYEPTHRVRHVFFPTSGFISLESATVDGTTVELTTVGREGMIGLPLVHQDVPAPYRAVVYAGGTALSIRARHLRAECRATPLLQEALLRYAGQVFHQISLAALCQQAHTVLQRLCRWLLTAQDHLGNPSIDATQDRLARALGSTRSPVAKATLELLEADAIWYHYGRIVILKRPMLESTACECYQTARLPLEIMAASSDDSHP